MGEGRGVGDKGESRALQAELLDAYALLGGHEAEDGEDDQSREEARAAVDQGHQPRVAHVVVVGLVVGGEGDERAPSHAGTVEDLAGGGDPHLGVAQPVEPRREVKV